MLISELHIICVISLLWYAFEQYIDHDLYCIVCEVFRYFLYLAQSMNERCLVETVESNMWDAQLDCLLKFKLCILCVDHSDGQISVEMCYLRSTFLHLLCVCCYKAICNCFLKERFFEELWTMLLIFSVEDVLQDLNTFRWNFDFQLSLGWLLRLLRKVYTLIFVRFFNHIQPGVRVASSLLAWVPWAPLPTSILLPARLILLFFRIVFLIISRTHF